MPEAHRTTRPRRPAQPRKKWATKLGDDDRLVDQHSREMAYAHVQTMREAYQLLQPANREMTVLVGPWGQPGGWEVHERIDLSK